MARRARRGLDFTDALARVSSLRVCSVCVQPPDGVARSPRGGRERGERGGLGEEKLGLVCVRERFCFTLSPTHTNNTLAAAEAASDTVAVSFARTAQQKGEGPKPRSKQTRGAAAEEKVGGGAWCGARAASVESLVPACATRRRPPKRLSTRRATVCVDRKKKGKSDEKTCHCKVVERRLLTARASVFFCPWGQPQ